MEIPNSCFRFEQYPEDTDMREQHMNWEPRYICNLISWLISHDLPLFWFNFEWYFPNDSETTSPIPFCIGIRVNIKRATLTQPLPLDKMAPNLANTIFECIFLNENYKIPIQIAQKIVPMRSPIENK